MQLSRQQHRKGSRESTNTACCRHGLQSAGTRRPFKPLNLQALEEAVRKVRAEGEGGKQTEQQQEQQQQSNNDKSLPSSNDNLPEQQLSMLSISSISIPACDVEGSRRQRKCQVNRRQGSGRNTHLRSFALHALIPEPPPVVDFQPRQENMQPEVLIAAVDSPPAVGLATFTTPGIGTKTAGRLAMPKLTSPVMSTGATSASARIRRWLQVTPMEGVPERAQLLPPRSAQPPRPSTHTVRKPGSLLTHQWLTPVEGVMERQLLAGFQHVASTPVPTPQPTPSIRSTPAPSVARTPMEGVLERPILLNTVLAAARMRALRGAGSLSTGDTMGHSPTATLPDGIPGSGSMEPCSYGASNTLKHLPGMLLAADAPHAFSPAPAIFQAAPSGSCQLVLPQPGNSPDGQYLMPPGMDATPDAGALPSQLRLTLAQLTPGRTDWEQVDPSQEPLQVQDQQPSDLAGGRSVLRTAPRRVARREAQVQTSAGLDFRACARTAVPLADTPTGGASLPPGTIAVTATPLDGVQVMQSSSSTEPVAAPGMAALGPSLLAQHIQQQQPPEHSAAEDGTLQDQATGSPLPSSINSTPAHMQRLSAPPSTVPSPVPHAGLQQQPAVAETAAGSQQARLAVLQQQTISRLQVDIAQQPAPDAAGAAGLPLPATGRTELEAGTDASPDDADTDMPPAVDDMMGDEEDGEDDGVADLGGYGDEEEEEDEMGPPGELLDEADVENNGPGSYGDDAQDELEEGGHMRATVTASSAHAAAPQPGRTRRSDAQGNGRQPSAPNSKRSRDAEEGEQDNEQRAAVDRKLRRKSLAGAGLVMGADGCRRSSRTRIRPLEYWRNEHKLFGREHKTMPTVVAIETRTPNPQWPLLSTGHQAKKSKARTKAGAVDGAEHAEAQNKLNNGKGSKAHGGR